MDAPERDEDTGLLGRSYWFLPPPVSPAVRARRQVVLDELGRALLRLRLARGWSQRALELASGVDQTTISRVEGGLQAGLSIQRLGAMLEALKVGQVEFLPPPGPSPTMLELMLHGDAWKRAGERADGRLARRRAARQARAR